MPNREKNPGHYLDPKINLMKTGDTPQRYLHTVPAEPIQPLQWHLGLIGSIGYVANKNATQMAGLYSIWTNYQGRGITFGIWDDGVQKTHWDLDGNYDALKEITILGTRNDGLPVSALDGHGTSVAGLIAAENNNQGGIGIAYGSTVTAIRIFGGLDDINQNWGRYLLTLDSLSHFDITNHSYGGYPDFGLYGDVAKFKAAVELGRGGLGTIHVKSAGNDNVDGNGDALDATRYTISVAAISNSLTGQAAWYSSYGSHILVSAPAGSVTTDLMGNGNGYDGLALGDYTDDFGGTSAAGPITAAVVGLMLDANPQLGWRDVQNILAYSSTATGSLYSNTRNEENFAWKWNGTNYWNGGGLHFSEDYGYGLINAYNAVRYAEVWTILNGESQTSTNEEMVTTGTIQFGQAIRDNRSNAYQFNVVDDLLIEHVSLSLNLSHTYFTDLRIYLISPEGTRLSVYDGSTGDGSTSDNGFSYEFGLEGFRGENLTGRWQLVIDDVVRRDSGVLNSLQLKAFGSEVTDNTVYHYTNEIFELLTRGQLTREIINDLQGLDDWINLSALSQDLRINIGRGQSTVANWNGTDMEIITISQSTDIENIITGDGNDYIVGNSLDNIIMGMRGDDEIIGGLGLDIAQYLYDMGDYAITASNGVTTISGPEGIDQLVGIELLRFADGLTIDDPSRGILPPDQIAPSLLEVSPQDDSINVSVDALIQLIFDEPVRLGSSGILNIYSSGASGNQLFQSYDTNSSFIVIDNDTMTVHLSRDLSYNTSYFIELDTGFVTDLANNSFSGWSSSSLFNFTTESQFNIIRGTNRNDSLSGTSGNDQIFALAGNDRINSDLGNDQIEPSAGRDTIIFNTALINNFDTIVGYSSRDDSIALDNAIFVSLGRNGRLNANFFQANASGTPVDSNDFLLYDTTQRTLSYDSDGIGPNNKITFAQFIDLVGTINSAEFTII